MAGRLARTLREIAGCLVSYTDTFHLKMAGRLARTLREIAFWAAAGHDVDASLDQMPWDYPDDNRVSLSSFDEDHGSIAASAEEITPAISEAIGESSRPYRYDVLLSFRGEDTRNGFVGHLHAALDQRGIATFMDDEELWKGEDIGPAILRAIGESRISIVVFSEDYASSGWCSDELVRIVECRDTMGQIVWPVFDKVDPSEVRRQRGRYGQALIKHEERLKSKGGDSEKVKRWREALTKAANISGWHLVDEREAIPRQVALEMVFVQCSFPRRHWDFGDPDRNKLLLRSSAEFMEEETLRDAEETRRGSRGKPSPPYRYDVFLSFRGEDTRSGFAGHLYAALDRLGIDAFRDEEELRKGEEIAPAILGAIGESRISIVVFSENYASSGWCLDELVRIVECGDTMGQIVWPVFYKVDPSDVRRQKGRYGQALIKHEKRLKSKGGDSEKVKRWREALTRWIVKCRDTMGQIVCLVFDKVDPSEVRRQRGRYGQALVEHEERLKSKGGDSEKVKRWREALTKAANISGWHLVDEPESNVIQSIVKRVWAQLNRKQLHVPENVVAMDSHVDRMRSLLDMESNEVRMVGICGFGGIGKTTIAKATYNAFADKFECCGFLSNVRETYEKFAGSGLLQLQEALISEVMWDDGLKLGNVHRGMSMTKSRLCKKKVLIVLDDVNQLIQLETLVGGLDWFGCGSRIIITTRDEHLLAAHRIESIYKVQPLDRLTACMLFSSIVFPNVSPPPDYEELSYNVVDYTKGLPLAIKILGSSLRGRSLLEWKSELDKLKKYFNRDIFSVLRMSFDGLDDCNKDIFLDIACFFKGESISYVRKILESCDLYPDIGIAVLIEKSLITIEYGKLEMHDMIQEMGREIVRGESPKEPGERSRLWSYEDVLHVLTKGTGTNKVEAIMLKLAACEEVHFSAPAFANMKRLRIFSARNVYHSGDPICFPAQLRWLEWRDYSPPSEPFKTGLDRRLVGLDLSKSSIRILGKEFELFRNLRSVNFSHCTLLSEIPDVSSLPNLESLDLQECTNLVEVHQSLGRLDKLVYLNFLNCCNLSCFPNSLKSSSLESLILRGCSKLSRFPDILVPVNGLKELTLNETAIKELPSSVANLIELKELYLRDCMDLKNLPRSIYKLQHLELIFVDGCSQLSKFPECLCESSDCTNVSLPLALPSVINLNMQRCSLSELGFLKNLHCISSLTILDLSENKFVSLPTCISQFTQLQKLYLTHCKQLQEILALPPNITYLFAQGCESLESCADLSHMLRYNPDDSPWLRRIDFSGCHKLIQDQCSSNCNVLSIEGLLGETRVDIFHPGSKIPKWFTHQNMRGLIRFPVSSESYSNIAGLAFCAIVGSADRKEASILCEIQLFVNNQETDGCVDRIYSLESDHIWLLYVPRRLVRGLDTKLLSHCSQFTVLFQVPEGKLRSCGVHLVYKQGKQQNDTD